MANSLSNVSNVRITANNSFQSGNIGASITNSGTPLIPKSSNTNTSQPFPTDEQCVSISEHEFRKIGENITVDVCSYGPQKIPEQKEPSIADQERIAKVLTLFVNALKGFKLQKSYLKKVRFLNEKTISLLTTKLEKLQLKDKPANKAIAFELNSVDLRLTFGLPLLLPLSKKPDEWLQTFVKLFAVHETLHLDQNLFSCNFMGIGRAGVVLEDIDYVADAVAVWSAVHFDLRKCEQEEDIVVQEITKEYLGAILEAMQVFDEADGMLKLPERRLRRYLCWAFQKARCRYAKTTSAVEMLLNSRVVIQLAPLQTELDSRSELYVNFSKQLEASAPEFFASIDSYLIRKPNNPAFDTKKLLESVSKFDWNSVDELLDVVVQGSPEITLPWKTN